MTVDTVFSLVGAMLMSEKIKAWTPNIYPHLVKMMDNTSTAGSMASEAQPYLECGIKTDNITNHNTTANYYKPLPLKQPMDRPGQQLMKVNKLPHQ